MTRRKYKLGHPGETKSESAEALAKKHGLTMTTIAVHPDTKVTIAGSHPPNRAERKQAKCALPMGIEGIEACRAIVKGSQAQKINEVFVDSFSASVIVQVYDALNEKNRATLIDRPVAMVASICFKLAK